MFNQHILELAQANRNFRQEVVTGQHAQVVLMSLNVGEDIGKEAHKVDQILYFVSGSGMSELNDTKSPVTAGSLVFVPAGTTHNFVNTGTEPLKLVTVYAPPQHKPGTTHATKADAAGEEPY